MEGAFGVDLGSGRRARAVRLGPDLGSALDALGLAGPRPVLAVIGGAGGMTDADAEALAGLLDGALLPVIAARDLAVVDGGTDNGVMRLMGRARSATGAGFPLLGVAAEGTVALPGDPDGARDGWPLEPNHTHFLLVPGDRFGDESKWLAGAATRIAGRSPAVTVLINGGAISFDDVSRSLADGRPVLVLEGTGRTADRIAAARHGDRGDQPATRLADSPLLQTAPVADIPAVRAVLEELLTPR